MLVSPLRAIGRGGKGLQMEQSAIFAPVGALAALTFFVMLMVPFRRFQAASRGQVKGDDFKFGESAAVPGVVSIPNRNYMNLLELPILFYVLCLIMYVSGDVTQLSLNLAWAYVGLRAAHSLVHLTFNRVFVRLAFFAASNIVLVVMWVQFYFWPPAVGG
jgi:hypothetical protein